MVFKGFTDVNGNVIPVQGAGMVYNEEKNSLALGTGTSAIGQDQFVFGHKNVPSGEVLSVGAKLKFKPTNSNDTLELTVTANLFSKKSASDYLIEQGLSTVNGFFLPTGENVNSYIIGTSSLDGETNYYVALLYKSISEYNTNDAFWLDKVTSSAVINYNQFLFVEHTGTIRNSLVETVGGAYYNNGDIVNIVVDAYERKARKEIFLGRTPQEVISTFKSLSCITDASSFQFRVGTGAQVQEDILARYGDTIKGYVLTISANYRQISGVYKIDVGGRINAIISSYTDSIDGVVQYPVLDSAANVFTEYITDGLSSDAAILEALNTAINTTHGYNPNVEVIALYSDARSANVNILQGVTLETWSRIVNGFNIRTLDWQGNQWNAGDITCDDGNGNTISMRDLLSRIATLEAAAQS